ncbi:hypothetical protein D3C81_1770350 [compost metagenome]
MQAASRIAKNLGKANVQYHYTPRGWGRIIGATAGDGAQKRRFHRSMILQFGQTDLFKRIGRSLPFAAIDCDVWSMKVKTDVVTGQI